jgi:hypothetical protein
MGDAHSRQLARTRSAVDQAPPLAAGSLVLDGQRSATPRRGWCEKGPVGLRLLSDSTYIRPRCKRRDCPRCWALRSRELARVLVVDANADAPTHCLTLTTRDPDTLAQTFRHGTHNVMRRLRRTLGGVDYFAAVEFTTGDKAKDGRRRQHSHALLKFRDAIDVDVLQVEQLVRETWERTTGAFVVEVAALRSPGAALGYLGLHHRKRSQAPPASWRGMTERASKGYWSQPIAELRERARRELAAEAHAWRTGLPLEVAELEIAARAPGELMKVWERPFASVVEPLGALL